MAHEILSIKLCQLDERLGKMHTCIHMGESENHARLQQEIAVLKQECTETSNILKKSLLHSKGPLAAVLSKSYEQMERSIHKTDLQLRAMKAGCQDEEALVEERILLAEYALDFAYQAADRALLLSLEAIDAQLMWRQKEGEIQCKK